MCGIAGVRDFERRPLAPSALRAMASCLAHRGPDETAIWQEPGIGLAHTRLSIIDLQASRQPMHSADGNWVLVFNGEIFNYRQLRGELDYPFRTEGDTEVLLAGLVAHGVEFVARLRGQFAFAAYDRRSGTVHLVRDRLGILPVYYRVEEGRLAFASEVKAIFAAPGSRPAVDTRSLDDYLAGRSVPAPHTLFEGVRKLPAAHRMTVSADGSIRTIRYWQAPPVDLARQWTPDTVVDAVESGVREAVRSALVADVPVGAYLSGGVDSSLIVAMMTADRRGPQVKTFSAGFGDPRHDELPWARAVSGRLGTQHHEVHVRAQDFEELWPRLTWHRDAPVSEPADVAVFRLAELARQQVKVVLSGEGGDELFGGYPKYRYARAARFLDLAPARLRSAAVGRIEPLLGDRARRVRVALRAAAAEDEAARLRAWFAPFTPAERRTMLSGIEVRPESDELLEGRDPVDRMLRYDLRSWLPDNLLERGDRMSMAHSLELRPPLLDHRLVELAFSLPSTYKVRRGVTKWALKEVARRYLPGDVVDRHKVGFRVPLDSWFRSGLRDAMWDRLTGPSSFVGDNFDATAVRTVLTRHDKGEANEEIRIWTLMSLEVWHETFIRGLGPTGAGEDRDSSWSLDRTSPRGPA